MRHAGWLPIAVFLLHEICAHVVDAYHVWPPIDIPLHLLGGFAIAFFVSSAIQVFAERGLIEKPNAFLHLVLVFALACTAAVFWELAEWTADHTIGTTCQIGLDDTILDLLMGVVGGAAFTIPLAVKMLKKKA